MDIPNSYETRRAVGAWFISLLTAVCVVFGLAGSASAAPEAHILRIDPRTSQDTGDPLITMVAEVVQTKRVSDATKHCASLRGNSMHSCMAGALEKPRALYTPFPFPKDNALFTVSVDGADSPAQYVSHTKWGESQNQKGVGTAWLIMIDGDRRMGRSFSDAKLLAERFIAHMGRNDIVNVMFFNDRAIAKDSKWIAASQKTRATSFVRSVGRVFPNQGRNRALLTLVKTGVTDAFKDLANAGSKLEVPMHQALVVLSSGFGGTDPSSTGPGAMQLRTFLTGGRFPENNTALPKMPMPVISVLYPHVTFDEFKQNSQEFMQNLANPEIGGLYTVMQAGEGGRSDRIVKSVRERFSKMYLVKWRVSCVAPSITQTFKLVFNNVKPPILGDNTFKEVPVGIDPTTWPLDVNHKYTKDMVTRQGGVYPGGKFKVFGNFCWGGDINRAEVYFLPAGQAPPAALQGASVTEAKRAQQQLIAQGMRGKVLQATDTFAEFEAPDKDKIIHGSGKQGVARIVLFDNKAKRASGVTADSILQVKATSRPFPLLYVLIGAFGVTVVALLILVIIRGGGRKRGGGAPPPAPPAGGGYPPQGGGYPPQGGGYPPQGGGYAPPGGGGYAPPGGGGYSPPGGGGYGAQAVPGPVAQATPNPVAQPTPGPVAVAPQPGNFSPHPPDPHPPPAGPGGGAGVNPEFMYGSQPPQYHLTADVPAHHPEPPPDPYRQGGGAAILGSEQNSPGPGSVVGRPSMGPLTRATLRGSEGTFAVLPHQEAKAGRDGAECAVLLAEPRVSGVHAVMKLEGAALLLRDEHSNNGTFVNGTRLEPGTWQSVADGSLLRFGPAEFSVQLETT